MSRPYFIRLPKSVINYKYDIQYYHEYYPYPKRMNRIFVDYDYYKNNIENISKEEYQSKLSINYLKKNFIDKFIKENYNAEQSYESAGGLYSGYRMNLYISNDYKYVYFYTMNLYKRKHAIRDYDDAKGYFLNIYRLDYKLFEMLQWQDEYEFIFYQKPSRFIYTFKQVKNDKSS